jgi:hypothetical protein
MVAKSPYHPYRTSSHANTTGISYTFGGFSTVASSAPATSSAPAPQSSANVPDPEADETMKENDEDDGPAYRGSPPLDNVNPPAQQGLNESAKTATGLHNFVVDHVNHALPNVRIDQVARDIALRQQRLKQLDPQVLAAVIWGSWKTVTALIDDPHYVDDEEDFELTVIQLIPFFNALSVALNKNRFDQLIQVMEPDEPIAVEADFLIFTRDDFLRREHLIEQKYKAVSLDKAQGYVKTTRIGFDSVSLAQSAQDVITLDLGECGSIQPPIPAQLLQDSIGQRRFEVLCVPGTVFFENIPDIVKKYRHWLGLCEDCGGYHPYSTDDCRLTQKRERELFSADYGTQLVGGRLYWIPRDISHDFAMHAQHYEHVYPGSLFLFQRIPPRVRHARKEFGACKTCGIIHEPNDDPSVRRCPYNVPLTTQRFIKAFHTVEKSKSNPIVDVLVESSDF